MKKLLFILILTTHMIQAQSWQWGKSGGGGGSSPDPNDKEEVVSMVTDSQKNIYTLSKLFDDGQQVAGQPVEFYGQSGDFYDYIISSFACDGTYRWSKVIGGKGREFVANLTVDAQDNIYFAGTLSIDQASPFYPRRIANDLILAYDDVNIEFLLKLNNMGVVQWIKRPFVRPISNPQSNTGGFAQITTDSQGNTYCLCYVAPGVYCDGLFTATYPLYDTYIRPQYIIKYDTNGNFVSAVYMDIQLRVNNYYFARNHNTGQFFVYGDRVGQGANYYPSFAGQLLQNSAYIACYGSDGQFLWKTENVDTSAFGARMGTYNLTFDEQNNIYIAAITNGSQTSVPNSFLGYSANVAQSPNTIFKIDPTGQNLIWASNQSTFGIFSGSGQGSIYYRNGKLGFSDYCATSSFNWGNQSLNVNTFNQGTQPLLARFNPATGECIGLANIPNDLSTYDLGRTLAIDASGDFIIGGSFGSQLFVGPNTLTATGASDFFIAKYSTTACSPLEVNSNEKTKNTLVAYPNPTNSIINICVNEACNFNIYSTTGAIVQKGIISREENTIDISKLASGAYTIVVITPAGLVSEVKVLRE